MSEQAVHGRFVQRLEWESLPVESAEALAFVGDNRGWCGCLYVRWADEQVICAYRNVTVADYAACLLTASKGDDTRLLSLRAANHAVRLTPKGSLVR
jgi:hypothetical protein